jgi:hypothetical protein
MGTLAARVKPRWPGRQACTDPGRYACHPYLTGPAGDLVRELPGQP